MRTPLLLAAFLLAGLTASAQTYQRPQGFLNLKWGASRAEVINALKGQGAPIPDEEAPATPTVIAAAGGAFAGQDVLAWKIDLHGGKFYAAAVTMKPTSGASALYRELKQQLLAKYGPASGERKISNTPEERRARIAAGYANGSVKKGTAVTWKFKPNLQDKEELSIRCEMTSPDGVETEDDDLMIVTLHYINDTRLAEAERAARALTTAENGADATAAATASQKTGKPVKATDL